MVVLVAEIRVVNDLRMLLVTYTVCWNSVLPIHTHSSTSSGVIDIRTVVAVTCLLLSCCLTQMSLLVLAVLLVPTTLLKPYETSSLEVDTS